MAFEEWQLRELLSEAYGVDVKSAASLQSHASFNVHYVADCGSRRLHATVRRGDQAGPSPALLEAVLSLEARLEGSTAAVIRTGLRNLAGCYLTEASGYYVSVREHMGTSCRRRDELAPLVEAAVIHSGQLANCLVSDVVRNRVGLRFLDVERSFPIMHERIRTFIREWHGEELCKRCEAFLDATQQRLVGSDSVLCHGDMDVSNMVWVGRDVAIIDHDCIHLDHPLFDCAHLLLSVACTDYFGGDLNMRVAERFAKQVAARGVWTAGQLFDTASYVLLKKMALVRQPHNLHVPERLTILQQLRDLGDRA